MVPRLVWRKLLREVTGKGSAGPPTGTVRVFRGGSWYDAASLCRSAFRYWDVPTYRDYFLGFRVAADLPMQ